MWCSRITARCQTSTRFDWVWSGLAAMMLAVLLSGCGGSKPAPKSAAAEPAAPKPATKVVEAPADGVRSTVASTKSKSGIPYDAFFDNPLAVAEDKSSAPGGVVPAKPEMPSVEKPAAQTTKPPAAAGALAWSDFLPVDDLQDEIKKVRNRLTASLQGQGTYNGNYKEIAVDGSVMAALAAIAIEHSGDVSWKANAPYIRKFGHELAEAATGLGKDNYEKSKTAFEKITAVFNGSIPADAGDVVPKKPFHEVASRAGLMKRIEKAKNWMKDNINTEAKLKSESDSVLHEAQIIATLGRVISIEGYSNTDEEDYRQYANALIDGAKEATTAAKDQSFEKFTQSMDKVNKSCDQCHANYGNG